MRQSMTEHEAVFKALEAGDGERASAAIRDSRFAITSRFRARSSITSLQTSSPQ